MILPRMLRIRQLFDAPTVEDIPAVVRSEIQGLTLDSRVNLGETVAITVGSRGIANIALIIKCLVGELKAIGLDPFLVPSMGSHGGGVAEAQQDIIESYGVTEEYTGAPIKSSMETVPLSTCRPAIIFQAP